MSNGSLPQAFFSFDAVQLLDPADVALFVRAVKALDTPPRLIVIDTLATCFVGGDENSAQDMGKAVDAVRQVQRATGAAVIVVHHTGKAKDGASSERGSSALRAAADAMIKVSSDGSQVIVANDKRKDDALTPDFIGRLAVVHLSTDAKGRPVDSCVLEEFAGVAASGAATLPSEQARALTALAALPDGSGTTGDWKTQLGVSDATMHRRRRWLVEHGYVEQKSTGFYAVTDSGRQAVMTVSGVSTDIAVPSVSHPVGVTVTGDVEDGGVTSKEKLAA